MEQKTGEEQQESPDMLQQQRELSFEEKVLMTTLSWQNRRKKISEKMQEQLQSQFQAKAAMVASLEAQYLQRQQNFSRQQKLKP